MQRKSLHIVPKLDKGSTFYNRQVVQAQDARDAYASAARRNPVNSGCGLLSLLLNSGWYCTPT